MITGYLKKTRLDKEHSNSKEDNMFEGLIRGVGRMKCLRIILENMFKELKGANKRYSNLVKEREEA
jgi:hypothetical protein